MNIALMLFFIVVFLFALSAAAAGFLAKYIADEFIYPESKPMEFTLERSLENGSFTKEELEGYNLSPFSVTSQFGYVLNGVFRRGSDPEKCVIFVHGHTWTWHGQVKYFPLYARRGYTIIAYNQRFHGTSGGENCSAGYFEKFDLQRIAAWARREFPGIRILGLMGESLGGATVIQYMPLDKTISFVHADCPYSSMNELYEYKLAGHHIPRRLRWAVISRARQYIRAKAGFDPVDASPRTAAGKSSTPLLLFHGGADTYVPPYMSREIAAQRSETALTTLVLIPGATHAQCLQTDPEGYTAAADEFLTGIEQLKPGAPE